MFKVRNFPRKNLKWWLNHESSIDFASDFQRTARVWKLAEQAFLIDSILNNFEIPRIYLIDFSRHNIAALNRHGKRFAVRKRTRQRRFCSWSMRVARRRRRKRT